MANDTVKSQSITNLDATPIVPNSAAVGAAGRTVMVDDFCAATALGLQSSGSYYKIARIPTGAYVKSVVIATDAGPNISGAVLAIDLNLVFSDAAQPSFDGTPTFYQGLIPQSTNTGATTTIASYSSPNKIYGTWKPSASAAAIAPTEFVFNGVGSNYSFNGLANQPLWQIFGFTDARSNPADPGGYFDLLAYVATGATTGGACNIYARVTYVI
jgi:hypothetical protein